MRGYELYSYFGRVLARFPFSSEEMGVKTQERACLEAIQLEHTGEVCWIRTY